MEYLPTFDMRGFVLAYKVIVDCDGVWSETHTYLLKKRSDVQDRQELLNWDPSILRAS